MPLPTAAEHLAGCYVIIEQSRLPRLLRTIAYYFAVGVATLFIPLGGTLLLLFFAVFSFCANYEFSKVLARPFGWKRSDHVSFTLRHTIAEYFLCEILFLKPIMKRCRAELGKLIDGDVDAFLDGERARRH